MSEQQNKQSVELKEEAPQLVVDDNSQPLFGSLKINEAAALIDELPALKVDELPGQIVGKHYEILSLIGTGGLGAVYKAQHKLLKKTVAVKFLRPGMFIDSKAVVRFQREAQAAVGLVHQNIAAVHEFGMHNEMPYIVMEFVSGESLDQVLQKSGAMPPIRAVSIFKQLLQALHHAHTQGVVHRDVKPENIIVRKNDEGFDEIKLIDFGIAKVLEAELDITKTGEVFGTPGYMSPEQCRGNAVDHRSDLYSAACVAFELLENAQPFTGLSAIDVILKHVNEPPKLLPAQPGAIGLEKVIDKALAKDPKSRYQSASEMLLELSLMEQGKAPRKTFHIRKSSMHRGGVYALLAFLATLCLIAFTVAMTTQQKTVAELSKEIREHPQATMGYINRAKKYASRGDLQEAIIDLDVAGTLDPGDSAISKLKSQYQQELDAINRDSSSTQSGER